MTIGIVGAGQLGRMMALAGYPLGFDFLFLDREARTPGGQVAPILCGELTDRKLLGQLSERCEVLTFDWENIPVEALENLPGKARISPPLRALAAAQDRLAEKRTFELLGIPTTRYAAVDSRAIARSGRAAHRPARRAQDPAARLRRQGPVRAAQARRYRPAWEALGNRAAALRKPGAVRLRGFDHLRARPRRRRWRSIHSTSTCIATASCASRARPSAARRSRAARSLRLAGCSNISPTSACSRSSSSCGAGKLVANEMAPRVHNSGHWTIEGAETSQFENHVRAICGLPLGSTRARGHSAMINLIGEMPARDKMLARARPALARLRQDRRGRGASSGTSPWSTSPRPRMRDRRAFRSLGARGSRDLARKSVRLSRVFGARGGFTVISGRSDVPRELQTT